MNASTRRRLGLLALPFAVVVAVSAWDLWPRAKGSAQAGADVPVRTAAVVRTDVATRQVVPGTLGYGSARSVVDQLPGGTLTWVPPSGSVVGRGHALYRVDDQPVTLMYGPIPVWRSFQPGMAPGPDVRELEQNLQALGFAPADEVTLDGRFTWATEIAIERWQRSLGMPQTGSIPLGRVAFLTGALRVTGTPAAPGQPVGPGRPVLQGTSTIPSVSVALPVGEAVVHRGDRVIVTLPNGATQVRGSVLGVGRVATVSNGGTGGAGQPSATIPITIRLVNRGHVMGLDQAPVEVTITEAEHRGVLAVPVTALLARAGGGYAVQLASGTHRLIAVRTGLFDDVTGLVEVRGTGLTPGVRVEVAVG